MAKDKLQIEDLQASLSDIAERFPRFSADEIFVLWFLRAFITESEERAAEAVSGGARDKGVDALFVDDKARAVFVVQAKNRSKLGQTSEARSDIISLVELAQRLTDRDGKQFTSFLATTDEFVATQLRHARKSIVKDGYRLALFFVTTGNVSQSTKEDAQSLVKKVQCDVGIDVIDGQRVVLILRDYLDGVAPPIPTLDLEMEQGPTVKVNGVSQRYDDANNIESWVFSMRGDAVADIFEYAGVRLFARNIRGFLGGATNVNHGMVTTLQTEPDRFFYYNNGITILCDEAVKKSRKGKDILQVSNPQVINGQQTTRTLASHPDQAAKASVLVKVIQVARSISPQGGTFENLVSRIVAGTNWQNAIRASDLMANDRIQIDLERSLRKLDYGYLRKRQTKGEAKRASGGKHYRFVKKEELAQAVAACDLDPILARTAREKLFEESIYPKVFPNAEPDFYLSRYWLMKVVRACARGSKPRIEARWLVLHFVWSRLAPHVRSAKNARAFRISCERPRTAIVSQLSSAIERVFVAASKFYRDNRGADEETVDVATFFKSGRSNAKAFERYWTDVVQEDKQFKARFAGACGALAQFEE